MCTVAGVRADVVRVLVDRGEQVPKSNERRESGLLLFHVVQLASGGSQIVADVVLVEVVLVVQRQTVRLRHFAEQTVRQALLQAAQVDAVFGELISRLAAALTDHWRITSIAGRFAVRFR